MKQKSLEVFIPGPAGRLEAKYYKNPKFGSPVASSWGMVQFRGKSIMNINR